MANCQNDWTPVIMALALQVPSLGAAIVAWLKYHKLREKTKVLDPLPDK